MVPNGACVIAAATEDQAHDTLLIADCDPAAYPPLSPEGNHRRDNRLDLNTALRAAT